MTWDWRLNPVIEEEPTFEDVEAHDRVCGCEYCRPEEWPPVESVE